MKLAEELNRSFQQIQKYEKGKNRVSASRLLQIAATLNQPTAYFLKNPQTNGQKNRQEILFNGSNFIRNCRVI